MIPFSGSTCFTHCATKEKRSLLEPDFASGLYEQEEQRSIRLLPPPWKKIFETRTLDPPISIESAIPTSSPREINANRYPLPDINEFTNDGTIFRSDSFPDNPSTIWLFT